MADGTEARGVALGFRVRTGRASAVALAGPAASPRVVAHREIRLHDPRVAESFQPHHAALELSGAGAERVVRRATQAARIVAQRSVREFVQAARANGGKLCGAAVVAGSGTDPSTIANAHMRAHALEGRLFPDLVAEGLDACGVACERLVERDIEAAAASALRRSPADLGRALTAMGKEAGPPWRALEKSAALAAWIVLATASRGGRSRS